MNKLTAFFAERDSRPPPGVKAMVVRQRRTQRVGRHTIVMETSCGAAPPRVAGSCRLSLYDKWSDEPDEPVAVKRFAVANWRECVSEMERLSAIIDAERALVK